MCGLAGIAMRQQADVPAAMLAAMNTALHHRGPDGEGSLIRGSMGIAHRRLSIVDIAGGHQPISDMEDKIHIVVNGEIYNYPALREMLEAEGVHFCTASDSEIPLHLYKKYGLDFTEYLDGMYALAILDETCGELILARDASGIKPLYTCVTETGVAFASEPSALLAAGWTEAVMNRDVLPCFLNRQFIIGTETLFKGIYRVAPGEILRIRQGAITDRYLAPQPLHPATEISESEALETFDRLMAEKTASHLQAEAPIGAMLSGGLDSSALVSCMAEKTSPIRTYTIGFESFSRADERSMAEGFAQRLQARHCSIEFSERDFWHYLPQMCRAMDDLAADYAALPALKLAQCAASDVKVLLSGEGGDEVLAGYARYRRQSLWRRLLGRPFRGRGDAARFGSLFREPKRYARYYQTELPENHYHQRGFTPLQTYQAMDMAEWLPNNLLLKLDRCLMYYGVEGRVPFLDREMIALGFALPDNLKIRGRHGKWLLKRWLADRHSELRVWQHKRGFTVPIHEWLEKKREKLSPYLHDHPALEQEVEPERLREWLAQPLDAKGAKLLFNFLCLALWYDIHILGKNGELPV